MKAKLTAQRQIESFWNLIQYSDERVQEGLYILLLKKYGECKHKETTQKINQSSFMSLKGILKSVGSDQIDKQMLDEYLEEKYGV